MDKREPDMVMVPVEPTEAMIAAAERLYDFPLGSSTAINSPAPDAIWSAMLSAAPSPGPAVDREAGVVVPRDQLETLKRSIALGSLLPGEGEALIECWVRAAALRPDADGGA